MRKGSSMRPNTHYYTFLFTIRVGGCRGWASDIALLLLLCKARSHRLFLLSLVRIVIGTKDSTGPPFPLLLSTPTCCRLRLSDNASGGEEGREGESGIDGLGPFLSMLAAAPPFLYCLDRKKRGKVKDAPFLRC